MMYLRPHSLSGGDDGINGEIMKVTGGHGRVYNGGDVDELSLGAIPISQLQHAVFVFSNRRHRNLSRIHKLIQTMPHSLYNAGLGNFRVYPRFHLMTVG